MRAVLGVALLTLLAGCGFQPVHAPDTADGAQAVGARVQVQPIPERLGQLVRNELIQRFSNGGAPDAPAYLLRVALRENVRETSFREDETATRRNIRLRADYELRDAATGEVVLRGRTRATNSANILDQPYATEVSERDARARGAADLADSIARDVNSRLVLE